jgi:hypothetical protein
MRTKRLKRTENLFYECVLKSNNATSKGLHNQVVKIVVRYSKGPTEATEAALHEAQLEDALPTEVKLATGKPIFSKPKRSKD